MLYFCPPIFEEDDYSNFGANDAVKKAMSRFLSKIGCLDSSSEVDFECLMSHILKCMGLFLKLRRISTDFHLSSVEVSVFLSSLIDMCEEGIAASESSVFKEKRPSASVDFATHVFKYKKGAPDESGKPSHSVWRPLFWASINPRWSNASMLQMLVRPTASSDQSTEMKIDEEGSTSPWILSLPLTKETPLHFAAKAAYDNSEALRLLSRHAPRAAFTQDVDGNLPLHTAAQYTESSENLQYLLQLNPKAIQMKNKKGRTPIHVLVARITRSQLSLLECLLSVAEQEDLMIRDSDGNTPLHLAWSQWSMKDAVVCRRMLAANPKAALVANSDNQLSIHCICTDIDLGGPPTSSVMSEIEGLVGALVSYYDSLHDRSSEDYPLRRMDRHAETPLHNACLSYYGSASWKLVPAIVRAFPHAATIAYEDEFPLHLFLRNVPGKYDEKDQVSGAPPVETVRLLLEANPLAASIQGGAPGFSIGEVYPLHLAAKDWPLEVVRAIYDAYPEAVRMRIDAPENAERALPLHYAAQNVCPIEGPKIIRFLYEKNPEAALVANNSLRSTPLHFALMYSCWESMRVLCELEPTALKLNDFQGQSVLVVFMQWRTKQGVISDADLSLLELFLKRCPEAALIEDQNVHMTPYRYSLVRGLSVSIQRMILRAAPEVDREALRELNYGARRGAMYLLYSAVPGQRNENKMLIWLKLRECADSILIRTVVSFL